MDTDRQQREVDRNYDAFQRSLGSILADHRHQYALMRDRAIIGFFDKARDAYRDGMARFADGVFSIQEVTDEPIDLGFLSRVGD